MRRYQILVSFLLFLYLQPLLSQHLIIIQRPLDEIAYRTLDLVQMLHRLNVVLLASEEVVNASNEQHAAEHDDAPVHVCHSRRIDYREEAGDASHRHIEDGESVDRDGEFAERETGGRERFAAEALLEDAGRVLAGWCGTRSVEGRAYQEIERA